jgi:DNA polymerase I-like protein with 3'-5' exonuclease and polymerase domains
VHDEEISDVPDEELPEVIATTKEIMNDDSLLSIPLTAGGATAKRWAMKSDI